MNRSLAVAVALAAALPAQTVTLATDSPYGVFARTPAGQDADSIPALTLLTTPVSVSANQLGADAATNLSPLPTGIRIAEAGQASLPAAAGRSQAGTTASVLPAVIVQGPHSLLMKIVNNRSVPLQGRLVVSLVGAADVGASAGIAIDVGNDASVEYSQAVDGSPHAQEIPLTIPNSLAIKITTEGSAERIGVAGRSGYTLGANVEFVPNPPPFVVTPYGSGCGGLQLVARDNVVGNLHQFGLEQTGAFPAAPGALLVGGMATNFPIPPSNCSLYNDAIVSVPFSSDATGKAVLLLNVPSPIFGTAFFQGVSFTYTPPRFKTSNGLKVECNG